MTWKGDAAFSYFHLDLCCATTNSNKRASGGHQPVGKALGGVKSSAAQTGDVLRMQRFTVRLWFTSRTVLGWWGLKGETPGEKIYTTEFLLSPSHFLPLSHPSWPKSPPSLVSRVRTICAYAFTGVLPCSCSIVTAVRKCKALHCVGTLFLLFGLHHALC